MIEKFEIATVVYIVLVCQAQARLTIMLVGIVFLFLLGELPTHLASRRSAVSLLYGGDPFKVQEAFMEAWVLCTQYPVWIEVALDRRKASSNFTWIFKDVDENATAIRRVLLYILQTKQVYAWRQTRVR